MVKNGLRRVGVLRARRLKWPVVSVGSLSAGGAGKTPVVIALAEMLKGRGWEVDVLSRGYGRGGIGAERVIPAAGGAARQFGDEPVMIARRTGVQVWVGEDRYGVGVVAEAVGARVGTAGSPAALRNEGEAGSFDRLRTGSSASPQDDNFKVVHLLDDGFQHRGLARAVDVVVVTEEDLEDALLPAGNRREPLRALRRADVVVVREEERERVEARVRGLMRRTRRCGACARAAVCGLRRCECGREARRNECGGVLCDCAAGGILGDAEGGGVRVGGDGGVRRSS
jgi:tetraacyldisaccharide 4'-kinase